MRRVCAYLLLMVWALAMGVAIAASAHAAWPLAYRTMGYVGGKFALGVCLMLAFMISFLPVRAAIARLDPTLKL